MLTIDRCSKTIHISDGAHYTKQHPYIIPIQCLKNTEDYFIWKRILVSKQFEKSDIQDFDLLARRLINQEKG